MVSPGEEEESTDYADFADEDKEAHAKTQRSKDAKKKASVDILCILASLA